MDQRSKISQHSKAITLKFQQINAIKTYKTSKSCKLPIRPKTVHHIPESSRVMAQA